MCQRCLFMSARIPRPDAKHLLMCADLELPNPQHNKIGKTARVSFPQTPTHTDSS